MAELLAYYAKVMQVIIGFWGRKMKKRIALLLFASSLAGGATADVYKCLSLEGKTIYSDESCGRNGKVLQNLGANTLPAIPVPDQNQQTPRAQPQRPPDEQLAAAPPFVANLRVCDLARRNAATTASSFTADPKRIEFAEREANIACYGTTKAGEIEQARAGSTQVIINNSRTILRPSSFITHCSGVFCYDTLGGRHPRLQP